MARSQGQISSSARLTLLWRERLAADNNVVMLWTFGKGKQRISLGRETESNVLVVVRGRDQLREYRFDAAADLHVFQSDMEAFLRKTGWTLLEFHPERRRREPDRRSPHVKERRRFWTERKEKADQPAESGAKAGSGSKG